MNCSYCSTELPPGAMFCGECGRSVTAAAPSKAPRSVAAGEAGPAADVAALVEPVPHHEPEAAVGSAIEGEHQFEAESEPEVVQELEPEPEPALGMAPEPGPPRADAEPEPEQESSPESDLPPRDEPERAPASTPSPSPSPSPDAPGQTCAQCGAELDPSDIFCGECGFVRQAAVQRPRDTVSLDPFPWGSPVDAPAARAAEPPADYDDVDETRIVDRSRRGERFVLQFSTGESVSVTGTGLLGRNPMPEPGEYFDSIVAISDPGKSVSKTHLEFGQDGGAFWVSDRYSGNGTVVREPEAGPRRCDPGKRYRVVRGTRVDIGEQFFVVS